MTDPRRSRGRLLREPLVHFALLGAGLFALYLTLADDTGTGDRRIVVGTERQAQLTAAFERVWRRAPTDAEFKGLVDDWLREELANREALQLGLGEDDPIIRRRLRQKYEAFVDQLFMGATPSTDELQAWYEDRRGDYATQPRYSLRQVYFSQDRRDDARGDARALLQSLAPSDPDAANGLGDSLALPARLQRERATAVASVFGDAFLEGLAALEPGRWSGPVTSAYGEHLVYLESFTPQQQPALEDVREAVLRDWRDAQRREARAGIYAELLQEYDVEFAPPPAPADDA